MPGIIKTMATTTKGSKKVTSAQMAAINAAKAHAALFKYPSSKADERYFKLKIQEWLQTPPDTRKTWTQLLFHLVWSRNDNGATIKYCYYSETHARVFLLNSFEEWATKTRGQIFNILKQLNAQQIPDNNQSVKHPT